VPMGFAGRPRMSEVMKETARSAAMVRIIMFGLLSSIALNMVVVPIVYDRFGRPAALVKSAS
jgi:hypothetical protein